MTNVRRVCPLYRASLFDQNAKHSVGERLLRATTHLVPFLESYFVFFSLFCFRCFSPFYFCFLPLAVQNEANGKKEERDLVASVCVKHAEPYSATWTEPIRLSLD